ncbi:excalibur calcium-binding domain-containing protein [Streptomyces albofaciens]|uniref:excalibur calcium-binding domain-containing protein n=1 Tax=Streptomyces albofaciens TaxID=66866 RepID=UPI001AD75830|nr:excalibur calcium-binding domain-containing protein [Streptomyces albofaciens]
MSAAVLAGCGSSGEGGSGATVTSTRTVTEAPSPSGTGTAAPSTAPEGTVEARDAASVVEDYYAAVNARDFRRAWDLGGRHLGGSYEAFVAGFADTVHDAVRVTGVQGDTVSVALDAEQRDGAVRSFAGTYTVRDGVIVGADIRAVAGPSPSGGGGGSPAPRPSSGGPDLDCSDLDGPTHVGTSDPHHLDRDGDGVGCEPNDE